MGFGVFHPRQTPVDAGQRPNECAPRTRSTSSRANLVAPRASFLHPGDVLHVLVHGVSVQRWADSQKELERVTEIVAVVAIERIGAVIYSYLSAKANIDAVAVRQVADVTERVPAHRKNFGFIERFKDEFVPGFLYAFPAKVNRVAATLVI